MDRAGGCSGPYGRPGSGAVSRSGSATEERMRPIAAAPVRRLECTLEASPPHRRAPRFGVPPRQSPSRSDSGTHTDSDAVIPVAFPTAISSAASSSCRPSSFSFASIISFASA